MRHYASHFEMWEFRFTLICRFVARAQHSRSIGKYKRALSLPALPHVRRPVCLCSEHTFTNACACMCVNLSFPVSLSLNRRQIYYPWDIQTANLQQWVLFNYTSDCCGENERVMGRFFLDLHMFVVLISLGRKRDMFFFFRFCQGHSTYNCVERAFA